MTAQELRIGNWLYTNATHKTFQLDIETMKGIGLMYMTNPPKPVVEPIPLDEEWLVKFGFEDVYGDGDEFELTVRGFRQDDEPYGDIHYITSSKQCYTHSGLASSGEDYGFMSKIEYVHQLQNLYFALTGEELTIKEQI